MFKKMTEGELCLHIGTLLVKYSKTGVYPAHLCIWDGQLQVRFCGHTSIAHPSFLKLTAATLEHDLSGKKWHTLAKSIYNYVRKNK